LSNPSLSTSESSSSNSSSLPIVSKHYSSDAATHLSVSCNGEEPTPLGHSEQNSQGPESSPTSSSSQASNLSGQPSSSAPVSPVFDLNTSLLGRPASESVLLRRAMEEWGAYQFPNQSNRLVRTCANCCELRCLLPATFSQQVSMLSMLYLSQALAAWHFQTLCIRKSS
jgi:hypothetical protein